MHIQTRIDAATLAQALGVLQAKGHKITSVSDLVRACISFTAAGAGPTAPSNAEHELAALRAMPNLIREKALTDLTASASSHPRLTEATKLLEEMDDNFRQAADAELSTMLQAAIAAQLPQEETP